MSIFKYNEEEEVRKLREAEREIWQRRGKAEGKAESVLEVLELYEQVPEYVKRRILEENNIKILSSWLKEAARAESMKKFLEKTGLKVPENK